jgi:hypothetical protein
VSTVSVPIEAVSAEYRATYHARLVAWYRENVPTKRGKTLSLSAAQTKVAELVSIGYLPCDDRGDTIFGKLDITKPVRRAAKGGA